MVLLAILLLLVVAVAAGTVVYAIGPRRVLHDLTEHPPEAQWVGEYTSGCTLGPKACGSLWDTESPR